jgi:hypothetical protein
MHRGYRYLSTLCLALAVSAPAAMMAAAGPQDDRNHEKQSDNNKRYYDKKHKDYHTWDGNEDRAYQRYQGEHHESRAFVQLNTRQQSVYWNWRHTNPDSR